MSDGHHGVESYASARTKAIESLLVEKGLIASDAIDAIVETYEQDIGPMNGAKVVARAWSDPGYKKRLLEDGTNAIADMGFVGREGAQIIVLENTDDIQNMVVCTLCSCRQVGTSPSPTAPAPCPSPARCSRTSAWSWLIRRRFEFGTAPPRCGTWCCRSVPRAPRA